MVAPNLTSLTIVKTMPFVLSYQFVIDVSTVIDMSISIEKEPFAIDYIFTSLPVFWNQVNYLRTLFHNAKECRF